MELDPNLLIGVGALALVSAVFWLLSSWLRGTNNPQAPNQPVPQPFAKGAAPFFHTEKAKGETAMPSIIGRSMVMKGQLFSSGDFHVDGTVDGEMRCSRLMITETGRVSGDLTADDVCIRGRFTGNIRAKRVTLCAGSHVEGDVAHASLQVEHGARFEGSSRRITNAVELLECDAGPAPIGALAVKYASAQMVDR